MRPTTYTEELAQKICMKLIEGKSLAKICQEEDMPAESSVYLWLMKSEDDNEENAIYRGFSERYSQAREMQAHKLMDQILDIADDGTNDYGFKEGDDAHGQSAKPVFLSEHVQRSRLRVDARFKLAEKMSPKKYGNNVNLGGQKDNPIRIEEVTPTDTARRIAYLLALADKEKK